MARTGWELTPHGADIGVRGVGSSKEECFEQAAVALTAVITDPNSVAAKELVEVTCEAPDDELLLVEWLNALVCEMATRTMLFARFEVHIDGHNLVGKAWGESIDAERHELAVEVKGATCTELKVAQEAEGAWVAQCVVDVWESFVDTTRLQRQTEDQWRIAPHGKMRVPAVIFATESLIRDMDEKVYEQVTNVATLPGIVRAAYAMPDAHWGYGFPIGGVAAFDPDNGGVISAGGVGFDIPAACAPS